MVQIGNLRLINRVILAPLAGITDLPFRRLAKAQGCGLVCSEMISANGLVRKQLKTQCMTASHAEERPLAVQLFGADPEIMAEAAAILADQDVDAVDINFGCSVRKVVKTGSGVALMRTPKLAETLLKAVRHAIDIPLTIKIRTGWDASGEQAGEIARIAVACGVDAITVHPRTALQGFRGQADWSIIRSIRGIVKRESGTGASIPVIGNGDIVSPADAESMLRTTGCDAVMIGRAAIGNPWLLARIVTHLAGAQHPQVTLTERFATMAAYLDGAIERYGEKPACRMMRSRLGWFVKGLPNATGFREAIKQVESRRDIMVRLNAYQYFLESRNTGTAAIA